MSTTIPQPHGCPYCGSYAHVGMCSRIKSIEYHQNGAVKRVELHDQPSVLPPAVHTRTVTEERCICGHDRSCHSGPEYATPFSAGASCDDCGCAYFTSVSFTVSTVGEGG